MKASPAGDDIMVAHMGVFISGSAQPQRGGIMVAHMGVFINESAQPRRGGMMVARAIATDAPSPGGAA